MSDNHAERLLRALIDSGLTNVTGVSIGRVSDRGTWSVEWDGTETAQDIIDAQAVIDTVDLDSDSAKNDEASSIFDATDDATRLVHTLCDAVYDELVRRGSTLTKDEFKSDWRSNFQADRRGR